MKYVCFEFDDLHPHSNVDCLTLAEDLCDKNKDLVLNFFVPTQYNGMPIFGDKEWCKRLQKLTESGQICLGVHGLFHTQLEFEQKSYVEAVDSIKLAESTFNVAGLPYAKVFRGPHWGINEATVTALIDLGYTHLYSHSHYDNINSLFDDQIKIIKYNFNFKDEWPHMENPAIKNNTVVCHGHTSIHKHLSCGNSIWDVYPKIEYLLSENYKCLRVDEI
jgi:hypothetical protein